jgi:hypothetical protein
MLELCAVLGGWCGACFVWGGHEEAGVELNTITPSKTSVLLKMVGYVSLNASPKSSPPQAKRPTRIRDPRPRTQ